MILFGTDRMNDLSIGTSAVSKIYVGTDLVYQKSSGGSPVLFDNGWIDGIPWKPNYLTRPQYTSIAHAYIDYVETEGALRLSVESGGSSVRYNAHVCTENKITIPSNVTKMKVTINRYTSTSCYIKFGLLPDNYVDATDGTNGVMSALTTATYGEGTYELALPSGFAGSSNYRAVVNILKNGGSGAGASAMNIFKVWFE